jgi:Ser-tRNA(Ala) deacylase AlaX
MHDTGRMVIGDKEYKVISVEKVGKCVLHVLDQELDSQLTGTSVHGFID